ncbi:hypothetical protein [Streptomyces sp. ML-6]|uniref:hypothetical protein n=1 Tax=Streptomyces sp. ML-6 TaxID=2982693 RepID=UPI0024BFE5EE|nr:hypothetical protein [Streptomyces sp. ML-6]MDK0523918.1 hypothetical protein [Streptomyces sp. ML-6]
MHRKLEALGTALLGVLVPRIKAAAGCGSWPSCWQCSSVCGGFWAPCEGCTEGMPDESGEWLYCRCAEC